MSDAQSAGAENAVVTGNHEVVRDPDPESVAIFPLATDEVTRTKRAGVCSDHACALKTETHCQLLQVLDARRELGGMREHAPPQTNGRATLFLRGR